MKRHLHRLHNTVFKKIILICAGLLLSLAIGLFLLPSPSYKDGFTTLDDVKKHAAKLNENISADTDNTIKPEFNNYYKTLVPTWKTKLRNKINGLLTKLHLKKPPIWSVSFFKYQLEKLSAAREAKGSKDSFICKITPNLQSKIVIFGNIQAAFHPLVRYLTQLKELNIINNELKVSSPDHFIVFMGDIVSRSPFNMETLSLVMKLVENNPENVVYLRGNHESANYWQEHSLKPELQFRASYLSNAVIPLEAEVNRFFNTLPLAIYIAMPYDGGDDFIRISYSGRGQIESLNENNFATLLTTPGASKHVCINLKKDAKPEDKSVDIKVIFKGEKKRETYQPHNGLRLLPSDMGSTAWTILSCPTPTYQKAIKFIHDAFVVITPAQRLDEWKITLYNRNVQTKDPFKTTTFYLLSGVQEGAQQKPVEQKPQPAPAAQPAPQKTTPTPIPAQQKESISQEAQEIVQHAQKILENIQSKQPAQPPAQQKQQAAPPVQQQSAQPIQSAFVPIEPKKNNQTNQEGAQ